MSRTVRRKNGSHHFVPYENYFNPLGWRYSKEVDGVFYMGGYKCNSKTKAIELVWIALEEYVRQEKEAYYERWGKYEHRDKKVLRHYSKTVKHFAHEASRANKRRTCHRLMKDPEADYLLITGYEKGIVWTFD